MFGLVGAGSRVPYGVQLLVGGRPIGPARSRRFAGRARGGHLCRVATLDDPQEVVADYESVSARGLEVLAAIEGQDVDIPIGDVGTYPASVVPTTFVFEAFVHIRYDLCSPGGPLQGAPPPVDQLRLAPTLDWIEAALPQQNTSLLNELQTGVELRLDGLCARTLRIGDHDDVAAHITSDSQAFVRWVTQRGTWESLGVQAEGDPSTLNVIRRLRVFESTADLDATPSGGTSTTSARYV